MARLGSKPTPAAYYHAWVKALLADEILAKLIGRGSQDIRVTAMGLASYGNWGRRCWVRHSRLADSVHFGKNTVQRHLGILVAEGWFTIEKRPGTTDIYSISIPDRHHLDGVAPTPP